MTMSVQFPDRQAQCRHSTTVQYNPTKFEALRLQGDREHQGRVNGSVSLDRLTLSLSLFFCIFNNPPPSFSLSLSLTHTHT